MSAMRKSTAVRSSGEDRDQLSNARAAAWAARSTSSASPRGTVAIGSSVAGFTTVKVPVPADPPHLPSMKIVSRSITVVSLTRTPSGGTGVRNESVRIYELQYIITIKIVQCPSTPVNAQPSAALRRRHPAEPDDGERFATPFHRCSRYRAPRGGATDRGNEFTRDW